jgi:pimeloyl-ACP methyl ester carboxylesterase
MAWKESPTPSRPVATAADEHEEFGSDNTALRGWRRKTPRNRRAVLFVHGFWGDPATTWSADTQAQSFLELIKTDKELSDYDIFSFKYKTHLLRKVSIDRIAQQLATAIQTAPNEYQWVLLAHSLGGLVCMQYIMGQLGGGIKPPVAGLILYGTPLQGVEWLRILEWYSPLAALKVPLVGTVSRFLRGNLRILAPMNESLGNLQRAWMTNVVHGGDTRVPENLRTTLLMRVIAGNDDWVVTQESARGFLGRHDWISLDWNHTQLVKPRDRSDDRYKQAAAFLALCRNVQLPEIVAKIMRTSDWVWEQLKGRVVRNWRYELLIEDGTMPPSHLEDGVDWYRPIEVQRCQYTMLLPQGPMSLGLALGDEAIERAWRDYQPIYIHSIRTGSVPKSDKARIKQEIDDRLHDPKGAWVFFFPGSAIEVRDPDAGEWIELDRGAPQTSGSDLLLTTFHLPDRAKRLVGREVDVNLKFRSIRPVHLRAWTIHFKWLTHGCDLVVTVTGSPEFVLASPRPIGPTSMPPKEAEDHGTAIKRAISTRDVVLPDSIVNVRWFIP